MNIQRFVIPATVAAAFHAVLLCALPDGKIPLFEKVKTSILEPKPPETPIEVVEPPSVDETDSEAVVTPLAGRTPRPELPDMLTDTGSKEFTVPIESHPTDKIKVEAIGPPAFNGEFGPPNPNGQPRKITMAKFLDKAPHAKVQMPPDYPTAMKHDSIAGTVMVEFDVDAKGRVVSARVRESTHHAFEEPTIRAVLKWRFEPGLIQGRPVPFRMVIPVDFKLGTG